MAVSATCSALPQRQQPRSENTEVEKESAEAGSRRGVGREVETPRDDVREEKEQGHGIQGLKSPSALRESLEGDRVIEARLSPSEHEGDTPRSHPLEDGFQPFGMSS